jgi:hypothetical protein
MSTIGGSNIVREGLLLYLDAANQKSYVSSSTVWRDLSLNNNSGSLVNGPSFDSANMGSIVFDGSDDYVQVLNNSSLNSTSGTVSVWFKYNSIIGTFGVASLIGKHDVVQSRNGWVIFVDTSGAIGAQIKNNSQSTNLTPTIAYSPNTWNNITLTYSSGVSNGLYGNAIQYSSGSCVTFTMTSQPIRVIDSVDTFWGTMSGNVSIVQVYNRALSSEEVLQNYEALKSRYIY